MWVELQFSAHCLMMLKICTKFHENILNRFRVIEGRQFKTERQTDKQIDGHCLVIFYFCTKFPENILNSFKVLEQT